MRTESKLLQYAFSCVSFISLTAGAQAQISYTDLDPDILGGGGFGSGTIFLDVNGDGIGDFRFSGGNSGYGPRAYANGLSGNEVGREFAPFVPMALKLDASDNIGGSLNWTQTPFWGTLYVKSVFTFFADTWGNWQDPADGYLPILVAEADGPHYGWVRISVDGQLFTIKDYAWNLTPNEPILAGQLSCSPPTATATVLPAGNQVGFDWDLQIGTVGYQVRSNEIGTSFVDYDTTTSNSVIQTVNPGANYRWQIRSWCGDEFSDYSDVQFFTTPLLRSGENLNVAAPEIFSDQGRVFLSIPASESESTWKFTLLNVAGQQVYEADFPSGNHQIPTEAFNSGIYFAVLEQQGYVGLSKKVLLNSD